MFKIILWIILLLLVVFFVVFNVEPKVTVRLLPGVALEDIPLALVIIVSFVLGLLFGLSFSLVQMLKRSLRKSFQDEQNKDKSNISTS